MLMALYTFFVLLDAMHCISTYSVVCVCVCGVCVKCVCARACVRASCVRARVCVMPRLWTSGKRFEIDVGFF